MFYPKVSLYFKKPEKNSPSFGYFSPKNGNQVSGKRGLLKIRREFKYRSALVAITPTGYTEGIQ
tara:strand:+ start:865 stop:1056 length:192 start_codon:yes stop_codon:yes gene_type:complete